MKKRFSLRFELVAILLGFVVLILGMIYVFQTAFLDDFYTRNKIKTIENVAASIASSIARDDMEGYLDDMSMSNEVCVRIVSNDYRYNYAGGCALRNLEYGDINMMANKIAENNGSYLFDDFIYRRSYDDQGQKTYIYGSMIKHGGNNIMILVSSIMTPLGVTISTIKSQYLIIALIVVAATVVLALLISKLILKPVKQINEESKNLSKGSYDGNIVKTASKEFNELNDTLTIAGKDIMKADIAKKELLGNVSHDLRTPLTMIVGYGEMIRDLPEENNAENINIIISEANRLSSLVDDLIDISTSEASGIELHKEAFSLNGLLESVYHQYDKYCESLKVDFSLKTMKDIVIYADEHRLRQVLYNFINNALNYGDKKKQKIVLGVEKKEDRYRVYVYDNGKGIDEKDIGSIWERYYKADKDHNRPHLGSGIGLSLSRELLMAHGLEYGVESIKGKYSKFYFEVKRYER